MKTENDKTSRRPWQIGNCYERCIEIITHLDKSTVCQVTHHTDAELIVKAVNAYDALIKENQELAEAYQSMGDLFHKSEEENKKLKEWIKSDSVYTLLRYGTKSPSYSGVDDCQDDHYSDLYNLSTELRNKDTSLSREYYTKEHFTGE